MKEELRPLNWRRGAVKRKITIALDKITDDSSKEEIDLCLETCTDLLKDIKSLNGVIEDVFVSHCKEAELEDNPLYIDEIDGQAEYNYLIGLRLGELKKRVTVISSGEVIPASSKLNCEVKLPDLKCPVFSGEGNNNLEYHSFLSQFNNAVGLRKNLSPATKLTYLRSYLKGYAQKVIQHLKVTDSNYEVALNLLNSEFLNTQLLVDELFKKLIELKPKFDPNYLETKLFINEVRCTLADLQNYDFDLTFHKPSKAVISHLIFNKLPIAVKQELVRKVDCNYPSIDDIFEYYAEVIRTINLKPSKNYEKTSTENKSKFNKNLEPKPVLSNIATENSSSASNYRRCCKFCNSNSHNMSNCRKFGSHDSRKKRCIELNLCVKC